MYFEYCAAFQPYSCFDQWAGWEFYKLEKKKIGFF